MCRLSLTTVLFLHISYHIPQRVKKRNVKLLPRHLQVFQKLPPNLTFSQKLVMPYSVTGKSANQRQLTYYLAILYISLQDPPRTWILDPHKSVHDALKISMILNFLKMIVKMSLPATFLFDVNHAQ